MFIIRRKTNTVYKNAENLLDGNKEDYMEINAARTKYVHGNVSSLTRRTIQR